MSQFRKLVEDIVKPQPVYTYLTPDLQKALDKEIEKAAEHVRKTRINGEKNDKFTCNERILKAILCKV